MENQERLTLKRADSCVAKHVFVLVIKGPPTFVEKPVYDCVDSHIRILFLGFVLNEPEGL